MCYLHMGVSFAVFVDKRTSTTSSKASSSSKEPTPSQQSASSGKAAPSTQEPSSVQAPSLALQVPWTEEALAYVQGTEDKSLTPSSSSRSSSSSAAPKEIRVHVWTELIPCNAEYHIMEGEKYIYRATKKEVVITHSSIYTLNPANHDEECKSCQITGHDRIKRFIHNRYAPDGKGVFAWDFVKVYYHFAESRIIESWVLALGQWGQKVDPVLVTITKREDRVEELEVAAFVVKGDSKKCAQIYDAVNSCEALAKVNFKKKTKEELESIWADMDAFFSGRKSRKASPKGDQSSDVSVKSYSSSAS